MVIKQVHIPVKDPVVSDPDVLGGTLVIKGTRVPASLVFNLFRRGYTIQRIQRDYPRLTFHKLDRFFKLMANQFDVSP